jgi:hypothetical protein
MTDMYLTFQIQQNKVVYLTLNVHPKGKRTALRDKRAVQYKADRRTRVRGLRTNYHS